MVEERDFEERMRGAVQERRLRVLSVSKTHATRMALALADSFGLKLVNLDELFTARLFQYMWRGERRNGSGSRAVRPCGAGLLGRRCPSAILGSHREGAQRRGQNGIGHASCGLQFSGPTYKNGKRAGEAEAVVTVLEARGISLTAQQRERILTCTSSRTVKGWARKAVSVQSAEELFKR